MKNRLTWLLLLCIPALHSCKEEEVVPPDLGYDFYPMEERSYIIYEVDSTHYGIEEEVFAFQVKELLAYEFVDGEGQAAMAVERYKRATNGDPWTLTDVWVQKRTPTTAERVEENVRFIRLVFPVEEGKVWNGNAYNTIGDWEYTITDVDQPQNLGALDFSRTLKVDQRYNVNFVDQEVAYEIYARNVGMIYKRYTDLNIQGGQTSGVDMEMKAIAYGYQF